MNIRIDRELCAGAGNCVAFAPSVFKRDEENKAVVLDASSVDVDTMFEAAERCPHKAIIIESEEGYQLYPVILMSIPGPADTE